MRLLRALLAFAAMAIALAFPLAASALEECNFNFKVTAESTAFQVLVERAQNEGGIWQPVREAPEDVQKVAKYVGMLQVCFATPDGKPRTISRQLTTHTIPSPTVTACTATLLPNNQLLTNHHCFYPPEFQALGFKFIQEVRVSFGYLSEDDTSGVKTYRVMNREIDGDEDLDVLLLQIMGGDANADLGGHFPTSMQTEIKPFQELKIIHHPGGAPQRYSSGTCKVHKDQRDLGAEATALRHTCETTVGSSGSLILDGKSLAIVGVHNLGGLNERAKGYNSGHRIAPINKALGLGLQEVQRVAATSKVDPCDPKFALAKQVNQCAVWDGYLASCPSHSKASEARRLQASACTADSCDAVFRGARASNTCDSWKSYTKACGNHVGMVVAEMAVELTCKPVADEKPAEKPKHTTSALKLSAAMIEGWIKDAEAASKRKDYTKAAELYGKAADAGDQCGQYNLGVMFEFGLGLASSNSRAGYWYRKAVAQNGKCSGGAKVALDRLTKTAAAPKSSTSKPSAAMVAAWVEKASEYYNQNKFEQALEWYRNAAEQGDVEAQSALGFMYQFGEGVTESNKEAVKWYRKAADQGYDLAQFNLGSMYASGRGVAMSNKEAVKWYRKAADQGYDLAQFNLGLMYATGRGVAQSDTVAVYWYRLAAAGGNSRGQCALAWMTARGQGTAKDPTSAADWTIKSLQNGEDWCIANLTDNATVREIQKILKRRGLYSGAIDGSNGPSTQAAMRELLKK